MPSVTEEKLQDDIRNSNNSSPLSEAPTDIEKNADTLKQPLLCWFDEVRSNVEEQTENEMDTEEKEESYATLLPEIRLSKSRTSASNLVRERKFKEAVVEKIKCNALVRIVYGDMHWQYARSYAELAEGYLKLRKLPIQALKHAQTARNILLDIEAAKVNNDSGVTDDRINLASVLELTYFVLGKASSMLKQYKRADNFLQKAHLVTSKKTKEYGISSRDTYKLIEILTALGEVARNRKQFGQAMEWFEKAIELTEEKLGNNSVMLIQLYNQLGKTELQLGEHASINKVTDSYEKVKEVTSIVYGKSSVEYADSCLKVGKMSLLDNGLSWQPSTEDLLTKALSTYKSKLQENHTKTLDAEETLCKFYVKSKNYTEAERAVKFLMRGKKQKYGDISEQVGDSYKMMGGLFLSQNKFKPAVKYLMQAKDIYTTCYGPQHPKVKALAKILQSVKKSPSTSDLGIPEDTLKQRPRFNALASGSKSHGYTRPIMY